MNRLCLGIISGLVTGGVVVFFFIRHQSRVDLQSIEKAYAERLAQMEAENARLSRLAAGNSSKLADAQLSELMRLRSEVGQLRQQQSERLPLTAIESKTPEPVSVSPQVAVQSIARDSWMFAGFQTPADAFQSVMWAMKSGDVRTFLAGLTPEAQEAMGKKCEGMSESEIAALLQKEIDGLQALRLDRTKDVSDTEVTFVLFSSETDDGAVKTRGEAVVKFKNVGGEWKASDLF